MQQNDRTEGRKLFVEHVLRLEALGFHTSVSDPVTYAGDTFTVEVTRLPKKGLRIAAWNDAGDIRTLERNASRTTEEAADLVWDSLEIQRIQRLGQVIVNPSVCDGGHVPCAATASWAYKINSEDAWMYACGRHLTAALIQESEGQQAEFTVRLINAVTVVD